MVDTTSKNEMWKYVKKQRQRRPEIWQKALRRADVTNEEWFDHKAGGPLDISRVSRGKQLYKDIDGVLRGGLFKKDDDLSVADAIERVKKETPIIKERKKALKKKGQEGLVILEQELAVMESQMLVEYGYVAPLKELSLQDQFTMEVRARVCAAAAWGCSAGRIQLCGSVGGVCGGCIVVVWGWCGGSGSGGRWRVWGWGGGGGGQVFWLML
jgi:hypothetical protein